MLRYLDNAKAGARALSVAIAAIAALSLLVACGGDRAEVAGADSEQESPGIEILSPQAQDVIEGHTLEVRVNIENFILDPEAVGGASVPGRGHWHAYIDGEWMGAAVEPRFVIEGIPEGPHHLKVSLASNDHSPLTPPVEDSIIINVRAPGGLPSSSDTPDR